MPSVPVQPIAVGFDFSQTINFEGQDGGPPTSFTFSGATRVYGQIRSCEFPSATLAVMDSTASPPTIAVNSGTSITFSISARDTANMCDMSSVRLDFAMLVSGEWMLVPVQIRWPVIHPATKPPL